MSSTAIGWEFPSAHGPVSGTVRVAGSKSLMARSLVLSAIADGPSQIANALRSRDSLLMADALRALGHTVDTTHDSWTVTPGTGAGSATVDCGLSGTVMRFVPPLAALRDGVSTFDGDPHARLRPVGPLIDGLRQVGGDVRDGHRGTLPFDVNGTGSLRGGLATIDASESSQFVSGLLLCAPRFTDGLHLRALGAVPNRGHIRMTLASLRERGVPAEELNDGSWRVQPAAVSAADVVIEPDASNSAPFLCAAAATGGSVTIPHWPLDTAQPIARLLDVLGQYGASSSFTAEGITVTGGERHGIDVDLADIGDMTPAIAAMCLVADSPSRIRGVGYIRGHETDRLHALAVEFGKLGAIVRQTPDGLEIDPHPLHGAHLSSYSDHRMVHAAAVAGLLVEGVSIDDVATTAKAMPQFVSLWAELVMGDPALAPHVSEMAR